MSQQNAGALARALVAAFAAAMLCLNFGVRPTAAQESDAAVETDATDVADDPAADSITAPATKPSEPPKLPPPKGAQRLSPDDDVWIDPKEKTVIVDGQVSLREGMLEMFACTRNTKEHESIVSANTKAFFVHAGLLRLGAEPGHPVQWVPEYKPPTGTEIEITVHWVDEAGKPREMRAQDWIKDVRTNKPMTHPWVFGGSRFWTDEETGKKYYQAEGGDFICVSNFGTAMLDIPIESSQSNQELAFAAFTEHIPPLGAPVRLILKPKLERKEPASAEPPKAQPGSAENQP